MYLNIILSYPIQHVVKYNGKQFVSQNCTKNIKFHEVCYQQVYILDMKGRGQIKSF